MRNKVKILAIRQEFAGGKPAATIATLADFNGDIFTVSVSHKTKLVVGQYVRVRVEPLKRK